jgi:hypothetical protein
LAAGELEVAMNASSAAECKLKIRKRARRNQRSPKKILETGPRTPEDGSKEIESTTSERDANASTDYRTDEIIRGRERV